MGTVRAVYELAEFAGAFPSLTAREPDDGVSMKARVGMAPNSRLIVVEAPPDVIAEITATRIDVLSDAEIGAALERNGASWDEYRRATEVRR